MVQVYSTYIQVRGCCTGDISSGACIRLGGASGQWYVSREQSDKANQG